MKNLLSTLTDREKKLLYVLAVFMLVVGGWFFVVKPSLDSYNKAVQTRDEKQLKLTELKLKLRNYQEAPGQLIILQGNYDKLASKYNSVMSNDEVDKLITEEILKAGLKPSTLAIADSDSTSSSTTDTTSTSTSSLKTKSVTTTVNGTFAQMEKLLDQIGAMKSVSISSVSYASNTESTGTDSFNISFVVYMIDKI